MPRISRDSRLETREKRKPLSAKHEPYWRIIDKGFFLGYRKGKKSGAGTWIARLFLDGKYVKKSLGTADDYRDSNGNDVLDYKTAQAKAREWAEMVNRVHKGLAKADYTVKDAVTDYLDVTGSTGLTQTKS